MKPAAARAAASAPGGISHTLAVAYLLCASVLLVAWANNSPCTRASNHDQSRCLTHVTCATWCTLCINACSTTSSYTILATAGLLVVAVAAMSSLLRCEPAVPGGPGCWVPALCTLMRVGALLSGGLLLLPPPPVVDAANPLAAVLGRMVVPAGGGGGVVPLGAM